MDHEVTLPMVETIYKRWQRVPPVSASLAAIVRSLGGKSTTEQKNDAQNFDKLQMAVAQMGFGEGKPQWLKEAEAKT